MVLFRMRDVVGVAQAIYDNQAEWPDELEFERGEILRVLSERSCAKGGVEINTGWWYCINKNGRRGIVPANRLRMLHRFDHNTSPQESISSSFISNSNNSTNKRRIMFNGTGRLSAVPFISDNSSLDDITSSSFTNEFITSSPFDSGSLFDRMFPVSPLERYKNTSLRHMSNGTVGLPPYGIVRNIPIKVESASSKNSNGSSFDKIRNSSSFFSSNRHGNEEPSAPAYPYYQKRFESGGRISPPPPPERKFPNFSTAAASSSSTSNEITSNDDDNKRRMEKSESVISKVSNGSTVVSKSKFDERNIASSLDDEAECLERSQKANRIGSSTDNVNNISWRLQKMGTNTVEDSLPKVITSKSFSTKGQGLHWSSPLESSVANSVPQNTGLSNESKSDNVIISTGAIVSPDEGSSSPSSSGIVADMNDSNGESNQRASATSSLSSCEPSSDLIESNFDTSRIGKTYRSRIDDPLSSDHRQQQPSHFNGITISQRSQLGRLREPSGLMLPSLEEKTEPVSIGTAVLNELTDNNDNNITSPAGMIMPNDMEQRFNHSPNSNNQRYFVQHFNRGSSVPPSDAINVHGNVKYGMEDRFRRGESVTSEIASERRSLDSNGSGLINEENGRKQIICSKLVENYRRIENSVEKLDQCTAARAWRQPHILQQHLFDIKEYVGVIKNSMYGFLDAACRIAVDINNPKAEELKQLLQPLKNSTTIITQLKQNLDNTGWTLSALSRPRNIYGTMPGTDALDQFLAVIKQLPNDCCKLIQWVLLMVPSSGVRFLTNGLKDTSSFDHIITSNIYQSDDNSLLRIHETNGGSSIGTDSKRQSAASTTSTMTNSSLTDIQTPPSILSSRTTTTTTTATTTTTTTTTTSGKQNRVTFADDLNTSHRLSESILESHVLEEDDLESVISDRDSFYQESAVGGEDTGGSRRMRPVTSLPPLSQLSAEMIKSLSNDDRQLIEFYSPQLDAHTEFLSKAIEEFLTVIEEQMPPHEFVRKGKLIILTAHKLIYMADTIAECLSSGDISKELKRSADRLLDVLKTCVQATKHAADEYLSVSAVQSMANCIVTVSRAAYDLKLLVKQCCSNG